MAMPTATYQNNITKVDLGISREGPLGSVRVSSVIGYIINGFPPRCSMMVMAASVMRASVYMAAGGSRSIEPKFP